MKVKDLIKQLIELPMDSEVELCIGTNGYDGRDYNYYEIFTLVDYEDGTASILSMPPKDDYDIEDEDEDGYEEESCEDEV